MSRVFNNSHDAASGIRSAIVQTGMPAQWIDEIRFSVRGLRKSSGFAVVAILALALGSLRVGGPKEPWRTVAAIADVRERGLQLGMKPAVYLPSK